MEEVSLAILGSTRGCSDESSVVSKVDSHEASSYAVEAELELGLGLSLGGGGGGGKSCKNTSGGWGESGRILTAKDFPSSMNKSNAAKPSSSSCAAVAISGTKRTAADSVSSHDHQGGGSPTSASHVVGWPPIRAYRMNSLVNQAKSARADHEDKSAIADQNEKSKDVVTVKKKICNGSKTGATGYEKGPLGYVKVNMDGTPIGRKVDLNAHGCYETLAQTLEEMFFKPSGTPTGNTIGGEKQQALKHSKLLDGSSEFVLTYEDKEGDWMLVGDVPWRMFLSSVKRLRIMRTSEANGLAPRFQERIKPV